MTTKLDAIRVREQAATPGEWRVGISESYGWPVFRIRDMVGPTDEETEADAEFIQHSRADIPLLLAVAEAAAARSDELQRELQNAESNLNSLRWVLEWREGRADRNTNPRMEKRYANMVVRARQELAEYEQFIAPLRALVAAIAPLMEVTE